MSARRMWRDDGGARDSHLGNLTLHRGIFMRTSMRSVVLVVLSVLTIGSFATVIAVSSVNPSQMLSENVGSPERPQHA